MSSSSRTRWIAALAALMAAACVGEEDIPLPRIGAVVPAAAAPGSSAALTGAHFCGEAAGDDEPGGTICAGGDVLFGTAAAEVVTWQDDRIDVVVPAGPPGVVDVVVVAEGRRSSPVSFRILEPGSRLRR